MKGAHVRGGAKDGARESRPGAKPSPPPAPARALAPPAARGADAEAADGEEEGDAARLFSWVRNGREDAVQVAIQARSVELDARDDHGNTPLIVAAQNNHPKLVRALARAGADLSASNRRKNTALHYAFAYGFDEVADFLIAKGADDEALNDEGLTPYEGISRAGLDAL